MSDFETIQNLKARYCQAADSSCENRDEAVATLCGLMNHDITADYGFGEMAGAELIASVLTDKIGGGSEWMVHNIHSPLIKVEGDEAWADWTVNVRMKRLATGNIDFVFGRYRDRWRRIGGEWKISRIEFRRYE